MNSILVFAFVAMLSGPPPEQLGLTRDEIVAELASVEAETLRRVYRADPVAWARDTLGDFLWSGQRRIMEAVAQHRKVAVKSCHEIGKSFLAARIVGWWLSTSPVGDAFVTTSAPSGYQVKSILWREINLMHARATGALLGRTNQQEWWAPIPGAISGNETMLAVGRKPDEYDPTRLQGLHALFNMVIFDEANGIPGSLWDAASTLIANDSSKFLAIGNPDDPRSRFAEVCQPNSGWHVIEIGAWDTPNFTGEEIPERLKELLIGRAFIEDHLKWAPGWTWAPDGSRMLPPAADPRGENVHPFWWSKILGKFPPRPDLGGLIPMHWITEAQARELKPVGSVNILGVDVGAGGDASAIAHRKGGVVRIIRQDHNPDTMQTTGNVIAALEQTGATCAQIDEIGIGKGVVDRGTEQSKPFIGINVGGGCNDPEHFVNLKAEGWWITREAFEAGEVDLDPADEETAAELLTIRYHRTSQGKIQIESKEQAAKRGVPSPNRAEAVMLTYVRKPEPKKKKKGKSLW